MAILISRKVLLVVALLSSLENLLVDGIRGGSSSVRRLPFERVKVSPKRHSKSYQEEEIDDHYYVEIEDSEDHYYVEKESGDYVEVKGGKAYSDDYHYEEEEEIDDYYVKGGKAYSDDYHYEEEEEEIDDYYYSKSSKGGKAYHHDDYYYSKSKSEKSHYYKGGKSGKSQKGKQHYYDNEYEVEYDNYDDEHVVKYDDVEYYGDDYSKSKGTKPHFPDFEYIEIGYKSSKQGKMGKSGKGSKGRYYDVNDDNEDDCEGSKSGKSGRPCRPIKRPKAPTSPHAAPHKGPDNKPSMRPPTEAAPTLSPAPFMPSSTGTSEPTMFGSFSVEVPSYALAYKLLNDDEPKTAEFKALEDATRIYLSEYFFNEFDGDDFTVLDQFITNIVAFDYSKGMPVVVDYKSYARFSDLSTITPTPEQMGSAVAEAFTGLNMIKYEDFLGDSLSSNNIFAGSTVQYYLGGAVPGKTRNGIGATGIAASAVAFTLLLAGLVIYKRKSDDRESVKELNKSPGDMTVAGETFAGETYDGTASVSAASLDYVRRYNDEEDGQRTDNLGSIPENDGANSIKPTWSGEADEDRYVNKTRSVFRGGSIASAPRTPGEMMFQNRAMSTSFEDVALQTPTHGRFQDTIMPDPSTSEDDASQMSDSELSQFMTSRQADDLTSGSNTLEIKSLLSMDSMEDNAPSTSGGLSIRDSTSRRLRTVAEIEALLSSDLQNADSTYNADKQTNQKQNKPRTVEEIESLLTADDDDDDTVTELPFSDYDDESIIE